MVWQVGGREVGGGRGEISGQRDSLFSGVSRNCWVCSIRNSEFLFGVCVGLRARDAEVCGGFQGDHYFRPCVPLRGDIVVRASGGSSFRMTASIEVRSRLGMSWRLWQDDTRFCCCM